MTITCDELTDMSARIAEAIHPEQIILFGSHALGSDTEDSDVDLLVITSEPFNVNNSRRKVMARLGRALARVMVPLDIVLFSANEVAEWRNTTNHLVARALREGRVLYERP